MTRYLTLEEILYLHYRLVESTGGAHGVRDLGALQSAVARPQASFGGEQLYPDLFRKAAALLESIVMNHPFADGNKRAGITAAALFLENNGLVFTASQDDVVHVTLLAARGKLKAESLVSWFQEHTRPSQP